MKLLLILIFFSGIFWVSAHKSDFSLLNYFSQNAKWTEELTKNKEKLFQKAQNFPSLDLHLTKEMISDAIEKLETLKSYQLDEEDFPPVCINQIIDTFRGLTNLQLWAAEVIDSTAKLNSGFLRGNFRNPGHFRQCVNINAELNNETFLTPSYQGMMCQLPIISGYEDVSFFVPQLNGTVTIEPTEDIEFKL